MPDDPSFLNDRTRNYDLSNTVELWTFDEGSGQTAYDWSGEGDDGTLGSSSGSDSYDPSWTDGKYSNALTFNQDYVDFGDIDIPSSGTIELWFRPSVNYDGTQSSGKLCYKYACIDMDFLTN